MELSFTKIDNHYECEINAIDIFNLHIERDKHGYLFLQQRSNEKDKWASVKNGNLPSCDKVLSFDITGIVFPKLIKIVSEVKPTRGSVTYNTSYKEDIYSYGVIIPPPSNTTYKLTRTGNPLLHKSLPVQSQMRGCLLDDDGNVVKYLDANDWTNEVHDGSQGQVMVELPDRFYKTYTHADGSYEMRISTRPLTGYHYAPKMYAGAYQASIQRSTNKLCSVVNTTADYRGGANQSDWDGTYKSMLGMSVTNINLTDFRAAARRRKEASTEWNAYLYEAHKWLFWLFAIKYATLNIQDDYNAEPTSEGYRQGGLGLGVTTINGNAWAQYNNYNPLVPCGVTDSLGNGTGVVSYTINNNDESNPITRTLKVPRYRGVENPFGHINMLADGINIRISPTAENGGDGLSKVYVCDDPDKFSSTGYDGYTYIGNASRKSGWITNIIGGEHGDIIPTEVGGGSTQRFCAVYDTSIPTTEELRVEQFGGPASFGAYAGLVCANSTEYPSYASVYLGTRLCFLPKNN